MVTNAYGATKTIIICVKPNLPHCKERFGPLLITHASFMLEQNTRMYTSGNIMYTRYLSCCCSIYTAANTHITNTSPVMYNNTTNLNNVAISLVVVVCGFFLACEDFGRMFDNSFLACNLFFFKVEISSRTLTGTCADVVAVLLIHVLME